MKYNTIFILIFMSTYCFTFAQNDDQVLQGKVTFITSKNVYVKFDDTNLIKIGDTLKISNNTPCLLVSNKSSSSVVCVKISDCKVEKDMIVNFNYVSIKEVFEEEPVTEDIDISYNDSIKTIDQSSKKEYFTEDIRARLSVASYSTVSNIRDDRHRLMSRFSLNANHVNNSKYSFETYLNYRQYISPAASDNNQNNGFLRVYNLAMKYDIDSTFSITLGRKINNKISTIGAIDGLQAEKFFGKNYIGVIAGFRPDIVDYGFNSDLLQYGAYIGRLTENDNFYSETTLGFAEQKNNNEIDRRFTYFQHSSRISKKLNLFSTAQLDLYNKPNDSTDNGLRLTNLYASARYRFSRNINLALSYDSRKRIIYYKTYETNLEQLLDEDIARQGFRARLNFRPAKYIYSGVSYSKRFQKDSQNKSDNLYGYVSLSRLPIDGRISLTYNMNSSNYLDSNIASIRYSTTFMDNRLSTDFYYRFVTYNYTSNIPNINQHYVGAYASYYLDRSLTISLSGEYATYAEENNFRINTRIIKRFYRQRKK